MPLEVGKKNFTPEISYLLRHLGTARPGTTCTHYPVIPPVKGYAPAFGTEVIMGCKTLDEVPLEQDVGVEQHLANHNFKRWRVPGDSNCMLSAVSQCICDTIAHATTFALLLLIGWITHRIMLLSSAEGARHNKPELHLGRSERIAKNWQLIYLLHFARCALYYCEHHDCWTLLRCANSED